jgi:hypothetical protein
VNERDSRLHRSGDFALDDHVDDSLPPGATEPVDVVQVRADEAWIASLSAAGNVRVNDPNDPIDPNDPNDPIDERLLELLRAWRDDVRTEPQHPLVDTDSAVAALASAHRTRAPRRSTNPFGPLATAAAVLVVVFIGVGLAARGAEPGDALWNVTKVLYSDKARSVEAKITVNRKLDQAREALEAGNVTAAMFALQEARMTLPGVKAEDGQQELAAKAEQLMAEVTAAPDTSPPPTSGSAPATTSTPTMTSDPPPPSTSATTTVPPSPTTTDSTTTTTTTTTTEQMPEGTPSTIPDQTTPASVAPRAAASD